MNQFSNLIKDNENLCKQRIVTNFKRLFDRIHFALESTATQEIEKRLAHSKGNIIVVGTGGSYAAATFVAKCISVYHPISLAVACRPRDVLVQGVDKIDQVILLSYSGKTKDVRRVYDLCKSKGVSVFLISNYSFEEKDKFYEKTDIISYRLPLKGTRERGFLSMAGTLIPMALFGEIYFRHPEITFGTFLTERFMYWKNWFDDIKCLVNLPKRRLIVDVFCGADSICTAIDLESKLIESGLARVSMHEKKDFSHGRFNILEEYASDIIIYLNNVQGKYSNNLRKYLDQRGVEVLCLSSSIEHLVWGDFDLLVATEFLATQISEVLKYDMATPDYPKDAMKLYKYSGKDLM